MQWIKFVFILCRNDAYLSTITTLEFKTCNFVYAYCHSECPIDNQIVYVIDISVNMNVSNCIGNFYHNSIFSWIVLSHIFWNRILCMHTFSSIKMTGVIIQLYTRYLMRIEFTNLNWYLTNNDILTYIQKYYYHRFSLYINMFLWDCAHKKWKKYFMFMLDSFVCNTKYGCSISSLT